MSKCSRPPLHWHLVAVWKQRYWITSHSPWKILFTPHVVSSIKKIRSDMWKRDDDYQDNSDGEQTKQNAGWKLASLFRSRSSSSYRTSIDIITVFCSKNVAKITKMKSRALLIEAIRASHARQIPTTTGLSGLAVSASPHRTLKSYKTTTRTFSTRHTKRFWRNCRTRESQMFQVSFWARTLKI